MILGTGTLPTRSSSCPTLQKLIVVKGEGLYIHMNKNSSGYNVIRSKSVPAQSSVAALGKGDYFELL